LEDEEEKRTSRRDLEKRRFRAHDDDDDDTVQPGMMMTRHGWDDDDQTMPEAEAAGPYNTYMQRFSCIPPRQDGVPPRAVGTAIRDGRREAGVLRRSGRQ
jgi:hypothetical protein